MIIQSCFQPCSAVVSAMTRLLGALLVLALLLAGAAWRVG